MLGGRTDTCKEPRAKNAEVKQFDNVNTKRINGVTKELTFTHTVYQKLLGREEQLAEPTYIE